jgi:hypothetical protein
VNHAGDFLFMLQRVLENIEHRLEVDWWCIQLLQLNTAVPVVDIVEELHAMHDLLFALHAHPFRKARQVCRFQICAH